MKTTLLTLVTALALGALAGCDRTPDQRANQTPPTPSAASGSTSAPATPQANTPSTPANVGQAGKGEGTQPPVQGREDVRQPEQRKDFQQRGDGAGPKQPGG